MIYNVSMNVDKRTVLNHAQLFFWRLIYCHFIMHDSWTYLTILIKMCITSHKIWFNHSVLLRQSVRFILYWPLPRILFVSWAWPIWPAASGNHEISGACQVDAWARICLDRQHIHTSESSSGHESWPKGEFYQLHGNFTYPIWCHSFSIKTFNPVDQIVSQTCCSWNNCHLIPGDQWGRRRISCRRSSNWPLCATPASTWEAYPIRKPTAGRILCLCSLHVGWTQ